jgi:DNA-3-methyladenine glycosylase I
MKTSSKHRCPWPGTDASYIKYHDTEWGVPVYDDKKLFEFIILEGAQAGLSWLTILKRREEYRKAFLNFAPEKVAKFNKTKAASLLKNEGIIRNRLKIKSAINNAKAFLKIQREFGSFSNYQWKFVDGKPLQKNWKNFKKIPATTKISDAFSKDLKARGFSFVGSTIIYAHMQAVGMVNDHITGCFRFKELS